MAARSDGLEERPLRTRSSWVNEIPRTGATRRYDHPFCLSSTFALLCVIMGTLIYQLISGCKKNLIS